MPLNKNIIADKIHEEHEYLKKEMNTIREMMNCDITAAEFPKWRLEFIWLMRDFYNDLQKHFDLEEEGGFMSDVVRIAPQHIGAIDKLEMEHHKIAKDLEGIIHHLKHMETLSEQKMSLICQDVENLLALLAEHEAAEGRIIETAYLMDYGGGD